MHWLAIALGGAFGAVARAFIAGWMQKSLGAGFPFGTLAVNFIGSFVIGFLFVLLVERLNMPGYWRELLVVGFLGALTTFSTFSLEIVNFLQHGQWHIALVYLLASLIGCFTLTWLGLTVGRVIF
ncbi:MAG: fluoride efflux transporter CrcB [Oceanospirillaceae bacterium]|nr:fluoride efflux transporter CrcB [Oceanospirillaceae bacterium]MCP5334070.1 fluoride efflux transporter CrcB [Oceanospirillaceae bacterium]